MLGIQPSSPLKTDLLDINITESIPLHEGFSEELGMFNDNNNCQEYWRLTIEDTYLKKNCSNGPEELLNLLKELKKLPEDLFWKPKKWERFEDTITEIYYTPNIDSTLSNCIKNNLGPLPVDYTWKLFKRIAKALTKIYFSKELGIKAHGRICTKNIYFVNGKVVLGGLLNGSQLVSSLKLEWMKTSNVDMKLSNSVSNIRNNILYINNEDFPCISPEVAKNQVYSNEKEVLRAADMWGLGNVLYEMMTGTTLFYLEDLNINKSEDDFTKIMNWLISGYKGKTLEAKLKNIGTTENLKQRWMIKWLKCLLIANPEERMKFDEIWEEINDAKNLKVPKEISSIREVLKINNIEKNVVPVKKQHPPTPIDPQAKQNCQSFIEYEEYIIKINYDFIKNYFDEAMKLKPFSQNKEKNFIELKLCLITYSLCRCFHLDAVFSEPRNFASNDSKALGPKFKGLTEKDQEELKNIISETLTVIQTEYEVLDKEYFTNFDKKLREKLTKKLTKFKNSQKWLDINEAFHNIRKPLLKVAGRFCESMIKYLNSEPINDPVWNTFLEFAKRFIVSIDLIFDPRPTEWFLKSGGIKVWYSTKVGAQDPQKIKIKIEELKKQIQDILYE